MNTHSEHTQVDTVTFVVVYDDDWELDYDTEADARKAFARDVKWAAKDGSEHMPVRIERRATTTIIDRVTLEGA